MQRFGNLRRASSFLQPADLLLAPTHGFTNPLMKALPGNCSMPTACLQRNGDAQELPSRRVLMAAAFSPSLARDFIAPMTRARIGTRLRMIRGSSATVISARSEEH